MLLEGKKMKLQSKGLHSKKKYSIFWVLDILFHSSTSLGCKLEQFPSAEEPLAVVHTESCEPGDPHSRGTRFQPPEHIQLDLRLFLATMKTGSIEPDMRLEGKGNQLNFSCLIKLCTLSLSHS